MEGHGGHQPGIQDLGYPAVNFLLFATLLAWQLRGPVREFFRARAARLREQLAAGDRARQEAQALRAQLAQDLADLPALRARLKDDLLATAQQRRDQLLTQGKQSAERIRADARLLAEQEVATASRTLREEIVDQAVHEATALVQGATNPQDRERFVREFVDTARAPS